MTCRKCKHEFCWTCGDPMDHNLAAMGRHNCNKYVDEGKEKEVEKSRAQLKVGIKVTFRMCPDANEIF